MKKRLLCLALSLVMVLTMLPVSVWAEGDVAEAMDEVSVPLEAVSFPGDEDNDQLLMGYLYQQSRVALEADAGIINSAVSYPAMNALALDEINQNVYDVLRERIIEVAASGGSTEFFVPIVERKTYFYDEYAAYADDAKNGVKLEDGTEMSFQEYYQTYFAEEGRSLNDFACNLIEEFFYQYDEDAINAFKANFKLQIVVNALLGNLPYEMYWFDKTVGVAPGNDGRFTLVTTTDGENIYADYGVYLLFCASENYCSSTAPRESVTVTDNGQQIDKTFILEVDSDKALAANNFAANARKVIRDNVGRTDAEKLAAYMDAIKEATAYNTSAANKATNTPYGDPWQLIYVFDGDDDTNVVCEGYAKAFKFLCDLSYWRDKMFRCSLVTGGLQINNNEPEQHMWNIVHISDVNNPSGANFLVDVTNCDTGTVGAPDNLFMKAPNGRQDLIHRYSIGSKNVYYIYDNLTQLQFSADELSLAANDYTPAASTASKPVLMWKNGFMTPEGVFFEDNGSDTLYVEAFNTFSGKLIYRDETGTETELVPDENAFILEDESFLSMMGYDSESNLLSIRAEKVGETTLLHEDAILTIHSGMPLVAFSSQPELTVDSILTQWEYNGSNTVYLVWPQGATDVTILPDEHSHTQATANRADGYATITITNLQEDDVAFEVSYQLSKREVHTHVHLRVVDVRPGLGFYHVRSNGESGYAREDGAALERSFGTMGKGRHQEVQFVITGEEETIVPLSKLTYDKDYIEIIDLDNDCVELAFNKFGNTELSVTVGKTTYTMPITIGLPDLGFYSSPEATEDTYLNEWIYTGEGAVIYLICQNGTLTEVTGADDNASGVSATILEGGKAAEIRLNKLPDEGHLDVRADYTRDDDVPDHGDAGVGFLMPQLVVNLSLPEGVSDAAVILWDKEGTAALEPQPEMRRIGSMAVFPHVDPGEYRLTVERQGCATRSYAIAVAQGQVTVVDAVVTALGDLNGSRNTDISDMACLYDWLYLGKYTGALAEERDYFRSVADVNNDGLVNILDYQALYEIVKAQPISDNN